MSQKLLIGILCLLMVPFIQGCDESDVAAGVAVGAVVGGTIAAVSTDNYYSDRYYRMRYNNYYRHRRVRYQLRYGHRYGDRWGRRFHRHDRGRFHGRRGHIRRPRRGRFNVVQVTPIAFTTAAVTNPSKELMKFADFYQMPIDSAEVIWNAQQRALRGDIRGLAEIGFFSQDFQNLVDMRKPSKDTLYRVSLRTGLDEDHVNDILVDFQQEVLASEKAGRIDL